MSLLSYEDASLNDITSLVDTTKYILLVTATETETRATHHCFTPLPGKGAILRVFEGAQTYYLGKFGLYPVIHVQCAMGSMSRGASIITVSSALSVFGSKVVIMVGIAFGVDDEEQKIGDVLVSESIRPYNSRRVGKKRTIQRGVEAPACATLINRFKSLKLSWEHLVENNQKADLIFTRLLSGEDLVDNLDYRNALLQEYPDSKGGEMEGAGVYAACDTKADWLIIKGICDFADGDKSHNKTIRQEIAIQSALSACQVLFANEYAFSGFNIEPASSPQVAPAITGHNEALFEVYDTTKEEFYVERVVDTTFQNTFSQFGVWIFGPPGCGKSSLITRNLVQRGIRFIQISLANCQSVEDYFDEIIIAVQERFDEQPSSPHAPLRDKLKRLVALLKKYCPGQELALLIEEIPISTEDEGKEFAEKLFAFISDKNLHHELNGVKFVLSSLYDPRKHIKGHNQKILSLVSFMPFNYWEINDVKNLIDILERTTGLRTSYELHNEIITMSKGSPRFVKKFYRTAIALRYSNDEKLKLLLTDIQSELKTYCNAG